jgi:hypothetical protein
MRCSQSTRSLEEVIWITVAGDRARGYPKTGFLNTLLTENVSAAHANTGVEIIRPAVVAAVVRIAAVAVQVD